MSEAVHQVYPDPLLAARTDAARALASLSEALVSHAAEADLLAEVAGWARAASSRVREGGRLERPADYQHRRYLDPPPPDGAVLVPYSERPVSGPANASAVDVSIRRVGNEAVGTVVFDRRFEGSPGRVHGGITASVFDDVMGAVNIIDGVAAYTLELTVHYVGAMPLGVPVEVRARTVRRDDRRSTVTAEARVTGEDGAEIVGEATAVFALLAPERLGVARR